MLPGQSAMPDCIRCVNESGLREVVLETARDRPFLGICLGLQMLFDESEEGPTSCLSVLPGHVERFAPRRWSTQTARLKVPHMGWSPVRRMRPHPLWQGISDAPASTSHTATTRCLMTNAMTAARRLSNGVYLRHCKR